MRVRQIGWIIVPLLVAFAAILAGNPREVMGLYQGGPDEGARWPGASASTIVPVCFRPPGTTSVDQQGNPYTVNYYVLAERLAKQAMVKSAIDDSWARWTNISFTGWGTCPADVSGRIYVDLIKQDCGGCGDSMPRGYHAQGVKIWLMAENPDERLLRTVAIHEFGHALGFHHEMDRPDATFPPGTTLCGRVEYSQGTYLTPYYDDVSVMNYCAPRNRNGLSYGDIVGSEVLYGTSAAGTWLKAMPGQTLFLDVQYGVSLPYTSR